jgi:MFS family permease
LLETIKFGMNESTGWRLPREVILLGVVSMLMDMASEMLYPIGPIYLTTVLGASIAWVGIIEGVAEAIAGLSKGYFGALSDARGLRRPFVTIGYTLSALSKPLPAIFPSIAGVLGSRMADRFGKGVRTAPRDALLAGYVGPEQRGAAFGMHRALDTLGAAIGPCIALLYLALRPGAYRELFLLAFIPAILAASTTLLVRERSFAPSSGAISLRESLRFWRAAPARYRAVVIWLALFALGNSSDIFLILRAREIGFNDTETITGYILYNIVFAAVAFPAGRASDRLGRKAVISIGLLLFAVVYALFALVPLPGVVWGAFVLYGIYAALTEGVAKAWIGDLVPNERRGVAIGLQTAIASLGALIASSWTGALWSAVGATIPLLTAASVAVVAALGIMIMRDR